MKINLHRLQLSTKAEHIEWTCRTAFERLVMASPKDVTDFWQSIMLLQARQWWEQAVWA
ncbi:MAG: hypothetical protein KA368_18120 [Acidobacteria bacterium]|nr:hypothetical protein [Acidobacteriota bacterium]